MRVPRMRLSVRALLILVLILGSGFGWVAYRVRVQRDAVAAIKRAGGSVEYDYLWAQYWSAPMISPPARVANAWKTCGASVSLMNRTEPSQTRNWHPPGCRLAKPSAPW
jgi:hypothetical protein